MKVIAIALLLVLTICQTDQEWEQYKLKFKKEYKTKEQEATRKASWAQNKKTMKQINAYNSGFTLAQNKLADHTKDQIQAQKTSGYSTFTLNSCIFPSNLRVAQAISQVNWKAKGKVSQIALQKADCLSTWDFAAAAVTESYIAIKNNTSPPSLSVEYLLQCTGLGSDCYGGRIQDGMDLAIKTGVPTTQLYPYKIYSSSDLSPTAGICSTHSTMKLPEDTQREYSSYLTSEQLKELLQDSPVVVAIPATYEVYFYSSGVLECQCSILNYGVLTAFLLYGYNQKGWLVKGVWGESWGEKGYATISFEKHCGVPKYVWRYTGGAVTNSHLNNNTNNNNDSNTNDKKTNIDTNDIENKLEDSNSASTKIIDQPFETNFNAWVFMSQAISLLLVLTIS